MKPILLSLSFLGCALLSGCTDSEASAAQAHETPPENGAQFKKGEGISITKKMASSIGLQTAEVTEQTIASRLELKIRRASAPREASGWVTASEAEKISVGSVVEIATSPITKGSVKSISKPVSPGFGEFEVTVTTEADVPAEIEVEAVIVLPQTEAGASIPRSALLTTAEGQFVYAKNGKYFYRTGITVGAMNEDHVEVTEGLYAGDEVVTTPVMSLWMAELQVLRGGKACNCGH